MRIDLGTIELNDEERRLVWFGLGEDDPSIKASRENVRTFVRMLLRDSLDEQRSILAQYAREDAGTEAEATTPAWWAAL